MRSQLLTYFAANSITGLPVSSELPWDSSGTPLYVKNFSRLYIDNDQVTQTTAIQLLNAAGIVSEQTQCSAFVVTDAKTPPTRLANWISAVSAAAAAASLPGCTDRTVTVSTELISDYQITQFDFSSRLLIV